jgi:hypothetical protein
MKFQNPFLAVILLAVSSDSFSLQIAGRSMTSTLKLTAVPSAEESAQALTNYMAKAHEEKLKALKALELKKDAEIKVSYILLLVKSFHILLYTWKT